MENIQAILFDLFGTLVEYTPQVKGKDFSKTYSLMNQIEAFDTQYELFLTDISVIFAKLNKETFRSETEFSMEDVFVELLGNYGIHGVDANTLDQIVAEYCHEWRKYVSWDNRVQNLLSDLKKQYKIGVITNTHNSKLVFGLLADMGILYLLDVVTTSIEYGKRKPNQNIFLDTCAKINVCPANCIFVGDSLEMDVEGSKSVGMLPIHISNESNHPHKSIPNILELRSLGLIQ
ncbi:HAD family hydrolase [Acinetobacter pecorum]|uniref:HAD family hydrolase n=1 Tax=Acinetobacter pecorum TaxID=2762215 RepID=UPI003EE79826